MNKDQNNKDMPMNENKSAWQGGEKEKDKDKEKEKKEGGGSWQKDKDQKEGFENDSNESSDRDQALDSGNIEE